MDLLPGQESPTLDTDAGASQTDWSMVMRAARDQPSSSDALEQLAKRYWPAIYAYIRSHGRDPHEAADLTQGFLCDVLLARKLLQAADPKRGRFRTLLLSSLKNYLHDQHRRTTRLKRSHQGEQPIRLDQTVLDQTVVDDNRTPEQAFSTQWGTTLLTQVLEKVRKECQEDGLDNHWAIFEERIVKPVLFGHAPTPYHEIVKQFELKKTSQAANMLITIKRRVVRALYREVRATVVKPEQVHEELHDLLRELEPP
jgi:RNA polymerase sigma-70 factor (ECF subfamily)